MLRIPTNVLAFANGQTEFYAFCHDFVNHYRAVNQKATVEYDNAVSFAEKEKIMNQKLLAEIMKYAGLSFAVESFSLETVASHPNFVWATYAVINSVVDLMLPETILDSIGMYTDVRVGGWGDSFSFDIVPRDLFVVTKHARGKRVSEIQKSYNGQVTVIPTEHDVTVAVDLYKVLAGKENLAEFVMKAVRSIETQMAYDAYSAFNTAATSFPTTPSGGELKLTGWSQADAVRLAQAVSTFNMGSPACWVGTKLALASILPEDVNYRYTLESDYVKIGYIRTFDGFDAIELPQIADWTTPFKTLLDDNRIYVVSPSAGKIVKLCIEGSTLAVNSGIYDYANLKQLTTLKKSYGAAIATNSAVGVILL